VISKGEGKMASDALLVSDRIEKRIYYLRKQRVMLSMDLAELYGVEPKVLVQAVKRNIVRFPDDFIFQLSLQEVRNLKSHFVTSSWGGLRRAAPYAFTEQGVAMLSSVLKSKRAPDDSTAVEYSSLRFSDLQDQPNFDDLIGWNAEK
jgi:hypothetical protein